VEDWNWETIFYGYCRSIFNHFDIIGLKICRIWWKTQNKGYSGVQGYRGRYQSKARMRLPMINSNWHPISYRFGVITAYCSNFGHCVFEPPFGGGGGLGSTYVVHLGLIGKRVVDFLLVFIELFSLGVTAESLRAKRDRKSAISLQCGQFDSKFQVEGVAPTNHYARIVRPMNALQLCCWQFSHKETL